MRGSYMCVGSSEITKCLPPVVLWRDIYTSISDANFKLAFRLTSKAMVCLHELPVPKPCCDSNRPNVPHVAMRCTL